MNGGEPSASADGYEARTEPCALHPAASAAGSPTSACSCKRLMSYKNTMSSFATDNGQRTTDKSDKIAILGGGILGMTLALRLRQRGENVVLYEAADHLGGLASAWELNGVVW